MIKNFSLVIFIVIYFIILMPKPLNADEMSEIVIIKDLHIILKYILHKLFIENTESIFYIKLAFKNDVMFTINTEYNLMLQSASTLVKNSDYIIYKFLKSQNLLELYYSSNRDIHVVYKTLFEKFELYIEQHIIINTTNVPVEHLQEMQLKAFNVLKIYRENSRIPFYKDHLLYDFVINNINWNFYCYTYDCESGNMNFIVDSYKYHNYNLTLTYKYQRLTCNIFDFSFLKKHYKKEFINLLFLNASFICKIFVDYNTLLNAFINNQPIVDIITPGALNLNNQIFFKDNVTFLLINIIPIIIMNFLYLKKWNTQEFEKEINVTDDILNSPFELCVKNLSFFLIITLIIAIYIFYHYLILLNLKNKYKINYNNTVK